MAKMRPIWHRVSASGTYREDQGDPTEDTRDVGNLSFLSLLPFQCQLQVLLCLLFGHSGPLWRSPTFVLYATLVSCWQPCLQIVFPSWSSLQMPNVLISHRTSAMFVFWSSWSRHLGTISKSSCFFCWAILVFPQVRPHPYFVPPWWSVT